jgi:hypothetical protein
MKTISRVAMLMAMLVLSTPKAINPITTSRAAMKSAHGVPIHFERKDAIEANLSESCRFMRTFTTGYLPKVAVKVCRHPTDHRAPL